MRSCVPRSRRRLWGLRSVALARLGLALGLAAVARTGAAGSAPSPGRDTTGPAAPSPRATRTPPTGPLAGFAINAHHISDLSLYLRAIDAIADLGANALVVVSPMFQERVDSTQIRFLPDRCPTDAQLIAILQRARSRGLHTALLPIVLIELPQEKDWRGVIRPSDANAWWDSYERFISRFVDIAVAARVDLLSVGSELNSAEGERDRWRLIIDLVRGRYDGRLTYTANWDRYDKVKFWPLVDVISISAYFELAREDPDASVERLAKAWARERNRLVRFARRQKRPFLLMEMGYPSLPWAPAHPWNYVAGVGVLADHEAQARCYRAFFQAWADTVARPDSLALGFHCYLWDPYHHGEPTDTGYGVQGKPAKRIIAENLERIRRAAGITRPREQPR
ncbi:MAG: glycoside hydrolase family 113 [Planctomycetota bacterium]|jgi:hypothetical protein